MRQRYTFVARAIVRDAVRTFDGVLTVPRIVEFYGLDWGEYGNGADRAGQLVRNELNRLHRSEKIKAVGKDGPWVEYKRWRG